MLYLIPMVPMGVDTQPRRGAYCRSVAKEAQGAVGKLVRFRKLAVKHRYPALSSLDGNRIERALAKRVADVKGVLRQDIPQTRQVLRKLIAGGSPARRSTMHGGVGTPSRQRAPCGVIRRKPAVKQSGGEGGI